MEEYSRLVDWHCYSPILQGYCRVTLMCTFLLHVMNCRIPDQERAHGEICYNTEYWIEREVQGCKSVLHCRSKKEPALVMASSTGPVPCCWMRALTGAGVQATR
jgi:hypothetical protein